jgi:hypothetical protein
VFDLGGLLAGRKLGLAVGGAPRVRAGENSDLTVERGREEHRLAVLREAAHDAVDLRLEAEVEHAVGLVEDEDLDASEVDEAPLGEILQPPRCGDEDVSALDPLGLASERDAAVRDLDPEALRLGERAELVGHLARELAGRDEDERRGSPVGMLRPLHDRNGEGERLARARRGAGENVEPSEGVREDERLDAKRRFDGASGERVDDGRRHAELAERLLHRVFDFLSGSRLAWLETPEGGTRSSSHRAV